MNEKETKERQNYKREKVNSRLFFTKSFESSDIYFSFIQQIKRLGKNTDKQTVKKASDCFGMHDQAVRVG